MDEKRGDASSLQEQDFEHDGNDESWAEFATSGTSGSAPDEDDGWAAFSSQPLVTQQRQPSLTDCFSKPTESGICTSLTPSGALQEGFLELLGRRQLARKALLRERTGVWLAWIVPCLESSPRSRDKDGFEQDVIEGSPLPDVHRLATGAVGDGEAEQELGDMLLAVPPSSSLSRLQELRPSFWRSRASTVSRTTASAVEHRQSSSVDLNSSPLQEDCLDLLLTTNHKTVSNGQLYMRRVSDSSLPESLTDFHQAEVLRAHSRLSMSISSCAGDQNSQSSPAGFAEDVVVAGLQRMPVEALKAMKEEMQEKVQHLSDDLVTGLTVRDKLSRSLKVRHEFVASLLRVQSVICNHQQSTSQSSSRKQSISNMNRQRHTASRYLSNVIMYKDEPGGLCVPTLERLTKVLDAMAIGDDGLPLLMRSYLEIDVFGTAISSASISPEPPITPPELGQDSIDHHLSNGTTELDRTAP